MEKPNCPNCKTNNRVQKAGFNRGGSQRFRCEQCQRYFTPQPKPMGYDEQLREQAVRLYLEGMSFRGVGKVLRVNHQSVVNWVNAAHLKLPATVQDTTPTQTVELDELFTFIGKKKNEPT
jgi:transposase-like protein